MTEGSPLPKGSAKGLPETMNGVPMNLPNLPNEAGNPLSEFYRVNERFRLTLRSYWGGPIFRLERWIEVAPGGLWIYRPSEGLSLGPAQVEILAEGVRRGLALISKMPGPASNSLG